MLKRKSIDSGLQRNLAVSGHFFNPKCPFSIAEDTPGVERGEMG